MLFSDMKDFVTAAFIASDDYSDPTTMPYLSPGPASSAEIQQESANAMVFFQIGNGPGLNTENIFDSVFVTVRVVGMQDDYPYAEKLAKFIDLLFLRMDRPTRVGTAYTQPIMRSGGAPYLLEHDTANRYHFQCTYIADTETGI